MICLKDAILELESGARPKGGVAENLDGIPSIGAEHLDGVGGFDFSRIRFVPPEFYNKLTSGKIEKGDILVVKDGATTGKVSFVSDNFPYKNAALNEHVFRVKTDSRKLLPQFAFYLLFSPFGKQLILQDFRGATVGGISRGFVDKIKFQLPALDKQEKIISILNHCRRALKKRRQTIRLADEFLKSAFLRMFGDPIVNSKGWPTEKLGNVIDVRDGTHDSPEYQNEGVPLVTSKNLRNGEIDFTDVNFISHEDQQSIDKRSYVDDGDILYGMIGTIGSPAIVKRNRDFCIKNVALFKFAGCKMDRYFVRTLMSDDFLTKKLISTKRGGTQKFVSLGMLRSFDIPIPPLEKQQKYSDLVQKVEKLKEKQKQSETQLQNLFNSLMQKAFQGEL